MPIEPTGWHLVCPNDPNHKRFFAMAHVTEEWLVNEFAEFEERVEFGEVTHNPKSGDRFTCQVCGAEAVEEG